MTARTPSYGDVTGEYLALRSAAGLVHGAHEVVAPAEKRATLGKGCARCHEEIFNNVRERVGFASDQPDELLQVGVFKDLEVLLELVSEADYRAAAAAGNGHAPPRPLSLYFHIPFCSTVCYYCACNRIITNNRRHAVEYLSRLEREAELAAAYLPRRTTVCR